MRARSLALAVVLFASRTAWAGVLPQGEPPPDCAHTPDDPRCDEVIPVSPEVAPKAEPAKSSASDSSGGALGNLNLGSCGGGGGSGDGVAILFAAVVGAALLPVIVFAFDDDASPEAHARWAGFSGRVLIYGGSTTQTTGAAAGFGGGRVTGGVGPIGVEASIESALQPTTYAQADGALVLRLPPKDHVELGLSLGAKGLALKSGEMTGFEVAVPHRYLFGSLFDQRVAVDVRPSVATNANDLSLALEAGIQIPLGHVVAARVSGRVFSLDHDIEAGALGGLELSI